MQAVDNTKKAFVVQASGADALANATDADKAKAATAQGIYNKLIDAITPFINDLIDSNTGSTQAAAAAATIA